MALEDDLLAEHSASYLRTTLISEIRDFIRSLEMKLPLEELTRKRDRIRQLLRMLSIKEDIEFNEILGKYFPNFISKSLPGEIRKQI